MKRMMALAIVLFFASNSIALEYAANFSIKTGDASLDLALTNINKQSGTKDGALAVRLEIEKEYSVPKADISFLLKNKYSLAEIYYMALLSRMTKKNIRKVAALKGKGIGWGALAKEMGVKPSTLNKFRVQIKKQQKTKTVVSGNPKPTSKVKAKGKK